MNAWNEGGGDPHWANSNLGGMNYDNALIMHITQLKSVTNSKVCQW